MMVKAAQQFDELCEIKDISERVNTASEKFSKGLISAKAIRMLYNILNEEMRAKLLTDIYDIEVNPNAEENMQRCPPMTFMPEIISAKNIVFCTYTLGYELIYRYKNSKQKDKFQKYARLYWDSAKEITDKYGSIGIGAMHEKAMQFLFEKCSRGKQNTSKLNLPTNMTFGVELEFIGIPKDEFKKMIEFRKDYVGSLEFLDWKIETDHIVQKMKRYKNGKKKAVGSGFEWTSPILEDTEKSWENLEKVCRFLQFLGGRSNATCGGHIHIGVNCLGIDSKAWENFITIWREVEPIIYLISNRKGEMGRRSLNNYAATLDENIDYVNRGTISIKTEKDLRLFADKITKGTHYYGTRYKGLNLMNLTPSKYPGDKRLDTIEFRLSNGTLDYNIIRENILLFGKILKISKLRSIEPTIKQKEFDAFLEGGLEEREKLERFLNLVFDTDDERQIFRERWKYNAGKEEKIAVHSRRYQRQPEPNPKDIKEQIEDISRNIEPRAQMEAMEVMIADLAQDREQDNSI